MQANERARGYGRPAAVPDLLRHRIVRRSRLLDCCYSVWSGQRGDATVPLTTDLTDALTSPFADHMMMLDSHGPGAIRIRRGGRVIRALLGTEARGLPVRALFHVVGRSRILTTVDQAFGEPSVVTLDLEEHTIGDAMPLRAQLLLLPLRDASGAITKALGCVALQGPIGDGPHRFRMTGQQAAPVGQCAASAAAPPPATPRAAGVPHLRLVT
jgi:hypothetical protein